MSHPTVDKILDWHHQDIEQRFGFRGQKYTDVGTFFALFLTFILTGLFFSVVFLLPLSVRNGKAFAMILHRGWTPFAMVGLFILGLVILFVKWRKVAFQEKAFGIEVIPAGASFELTPTTAQEALKRLSSFVDDPKQFVLFNRIERSLLNLRNLGNLSDVSEMLRSQAENDENHMESSYGILQGIVWTLPILGFIGTVTGLSGAIGAFGKALNAGTSIGDLREGLAPVTDNLGIAFDTTFVALILAMIIQILMTLLRKREELFLDACRDYAHGNVISRLRLIENQQTPSPAVEKE